MKKLIFIFSMLAILCVSTTAHAIDSKYQYIKVGLQYGDSAAATASLECDGGFSVGFIVDGVFNESEVYDCTSVVISAEADGSINIILSDGTIKNTLTDEKNIFTVYPKSGFLKINGSSYRGAAMLLNFGGKSLTVINYLGLEEYLYGVISSEMPSSWNIEALKAQAVCARSFAVTNWSKHASYGFNVCKTTNCQVYGGISSETQSSVRAADETVGKLLMYDGAVAQTLFFSTSGGYTADVKNVWGSSVPYLCGVEDPYENPSEASRHTWTATLSTADIKTSLSSIGVDIGDIIDISAEIDDTTHVYKLDISGTDGSYTLKNQSVCSVFSSFGVQSQKYTITPYGGGMEALYAVSADKTERIDKFNVITSDGSITDVQMPTALMAASGLYVPDSGTPEGYIFNGGGWGHGVGMSQYGAKGMADNGYTYDKILYHYYPGTYLE